MIEASYLTQKKMVFEIVDARPEGRFLGRDPEPRPGVPSGHIPGSKSLPFKLLLNPDDTFKTNEEIKQVFEQKEVDLGKFVVTTCGSGVTASVINFALELIGVSRKAVYDGSWAEFANKQNQLTELGMFVYLQIFKRD